MSLSGAVPLPTLEQAGVFLKSAGAGTQWQLVGIVCPVGCLMSLCRVSLSLVTLPHLCHLGWLLQDTAF